MNYAGIDPGYGGALCFLNSNNCPVMYRMPIITTKTKVKEKWRTKNKYDLFKIIEIFNNHLPKNKNNITVFLERVSSQRGEGVVSSFSFGEGYGALQGIITSIFNKSPILVSPQTWKKVYPQLITEEIKEKKEEVKELKLLSKTLEDIDSKKENKKQIDRLYRQIKSAAKTSARKLAMELYPDLADNFQAKNSDGLAESLLIALYGRNNDLV